MNKKTRVVVIGGGFAGVKAARKLNRAENISITLISDKPDFRYSPALYRTATGHQKRESFIPLQSLVRNLSNVSLVEDKVVKIDRETKTIVTQNGQSYQYDYCVLALGMVTSYFGIPGLDKYSFGIKSSQEVTELKRHLHQELIEEHEMDKNYVIVGAGPTGVELAAELGQYLKRIAKFHKIKHKKVSLELIEAAPRVLPSLNPRASRLAKTRLKKQDVKILLGKRVEAETINTLKVDDRSIPTHTVIWTAGVTSNQFFSDNASQFTFDDKKRVSVNQFLQVDDFTFVAGDNAATRYSGLALTAVHDAKSIAMNIIRLTQGKTPRVYHALLPISAVPLGKNRAVIQWGPLVFDGVLGGIIRRLADLVGYADIMGYYAALRLWLKKDSYEETCTICSSPELIQESSN